MFFVVDFMGIRFLRNVSKDYLYFTSTYVRRLGLWGWMVNSPYVIPINESILGQVFAEAN